MDRKADIVKKTVPKIIFVVYLLILIKLIIFKYPIEMFQSIMENWCPEMVSANLSTANFKLFKTISTYIRHWDQRGINSFGNLIGNVVAFIPFGYMLPIVWKRAKNFFLCMGTALLFIVSIELFQLISTFGAFDVDDILLNGIGAFIGFICFHLARKMIAPKVLKDDSGRNNKASAK